MNEAEAKEVTTQTAKPVPESAKKPAPVIRPPVDVFEDESGITVQADMPGVSKERLTVNIDRDTLAIEGEAEIRMPEEMHSVYADVRSTLYQRSFSLSSELDGEKADASLKDGILTLRIPKRAQYQPRKIEVQVG